MSTSDPFFSLAAALMLLVKSSFKILISCLTVFQWLKSVGENLMSLIGLSRGRAEGAKVAISAGQLQYCTQV